MTILFWPDTLRDPSHASLTLRGMTQTNVSPFDGSAQTLALPGARWVGSMAWERIPVEHWRDLMQFISQLGGRAGRFKLKHPLTARMATASPGTPLVAGGSQTGASLVTDGWTPSALVMKKGDFFEWPTASTRPQMHQVTADVTANGSGQATLTFAPPLRSSPADNASLNVAYPGAIFMLSGDDQGAISVSGADVYRGSASVEFEEALFG